MGKEGYIGHMVLVVGYDEESLIVHNAYFDPIPNQRVTDQVLYSAWEDFSGGFWLQAFRLSGETVKH
jgi:uncharacterized protein YvpB